MKNKSQPTSPKLPLSRGKRFVFGAVMICLPFVLLLATEGVLRLCGYGGNASIFRNAGPVAGGSLVISDQDGAISYFFANRDRPGYNDQYQFTEPKGSNTFRIFTVGESAMKGFPQPRNLASTSFLQTMLQDAWPQRNVEVINLGTTAVASYPVLGMMTEALDYSPDLVVIYTGHNEFFGTYGVASIGRAGGKPWMLGVTRSVHSLAIVQAWTKLTTAKTPEGNITLMERMVGRTYVSPDDWSRAAAANNLYHNVREMLRRCQARGVPVLVCTQPSNERDLAPIGAEKSGDASARAEFQIAQSLYASNQFPQALAAFQKARDLDTMPWRATSAANESISRAAQELNATVCDVEGAFHTNSPGGSIGWELMDDHVHPTLRGQALIAEAIVQSLSRMTGAVSLSAEALTRIGDWQSYAERLGDNKYDRYAVAHMMRVIFGVPFMRETNPDAYRHFDRIASELEKAEPPEIQELMREYQTVRPHAGGKRPITGMVARQFMREKRYEEALKYYQIAQRSVPEYTSWHMEYRLFHAGLPGEKLAGKLSDEERKLALGEIEQGKFLLQRGFSQTGFTERYTGRLHQLRGEFAEAIPFLNASREKLTGFELVAADQALFTSFLEDGSPCRCQNACREWRRQERAIRWLLQTDVGNLKSEKSGEAGLATKRHNKHKESKLIRPVLCLLCFFVAIHLKNKGVSSNQLHTNMRWTFWLRWTHNPSNTMKTNLSQVRCFFTAIIFSLIAFNPLSALRQIHQWLPRAKSPDWLRKSVIYEIFPRNFSKEGHLNAITARLDELKDLGVDALWLMPIHPIGEKMKKGSLGSPYAVRDYFAINPDYGTADDFKKLVAGAHQRGMKVIMDIVAGHTAWDSVLIEQHPEFYKKDAAGKIIPPNPDWTDVAGLNYENQELRRYMIEMLKHWTKNFGVDGFRCDVAFTVPTEFWETARRELEQLNPEVVLLADANAAPKLVAKAFDMDNSGALHSALNRVMSGVAPAYLLQQSWENTRQQFPQGSLHLRFSDDHETTRAIARFGMNGALAVQVLMLTLDGVPMFYNGMEVGDAAESSDPALFEKLPIFWNVNGRPPLRDIYRNLIKLRKQHPAFQNDNVAWLQNTVSAEVVTFSRKDDKDEFVICINLSSRMASGSVEVPNAEEFTLLKIDGMPASPKNLLPEFRLAGYEWRIYQRSLAK